MTDLFPTHSSQKVRRNLREAQLMEFIVRRGEGRLAQSGAIGVETGQHTGRSAEDKYIVRDAETDGAIWWDNAKEMSEEQFDRLLADFIAFARHKEIFVQDLYAGAEAAHRLNTPHRHRARLAVLVHSPSSAAAGRKRTRGVHP